ncbi:SET domain-containing protein [Saccharicrinis sp. FJH62]|uniref:SET domain-containing protein n=1 Tax=Saccharicrinis sp. FJH62 TaxID=3344657 RepID=UPI0035D40EF4
MIHPHTELKFISEEIGYGVVATKTIPAGTIIWIHDKLDREFTLQEIQNMEPVYQSVILNYTFRNNKGNYIFCWDNGRFINHSFKSNCLSTAYDFEIAIRDIQPGEELTDDYGYLNILEPFRAANEGTKRKMVYPDDLLRYHRTWDKKIARVFNKITKLDQPLKPLIANGTWEKVEKIISGELQADSILNNYFDPAQKLQE